MQTQSNDPAELFDVEPPSDGRGTFGRRIALAFASVAAITALLAAVVISSVWNYQFDQYVRGNLQRTADGIAQVGAQAYVHYGGWTLASLSAIPRYGMMRGIGVQILDTDGRIIFDDLNGATAQTGTNSAVPEPNGTVVTSAIIIGAEQVGTVRVWAYGSTALMTERDEQFRRGSAVALTISALAAIVLASLAGLWYANRLVRPIEQITAAAQALRQGQSNARTGMSGDDEIGLLGLTFDEMADAIEADRELERRLTADVAHELRTPLQAIQATVEAMQDGVLPADEERLGTVRDETVRLARLADAILELTRLERGSLPFEFRMIDLASIVAPTIDAHTALIESKGIELHAEVEEGITVIADADRLRQAIGNLLSNAARYTPAGGQVKVQLRRQDKEAVLTVSDTGIGIAEEDLAHVFDRFWRADEARASATGGLGVGLAVTKEIVDRHRGSIWARSERGEGATFEIRLPIATQPPVASARSGQQKRRTIG